MDIKYYFIRLLQKTVLLSNFLQSKLIKRRKIKLNWKEKILMIKCDRIWDAVWSVFFCDILKQNYPNLEISVVSNNYNRFVFEENIRLFKEIYSIDEQPPAYLVKNIYKLFTIFLEPFMVFKKNKQLWEKLKTKKFDYIFNITWRDYVLISKFLGKSMWWGLGIFNGIYTYPIIWHNEIGAKKHIVLKRLDNIDNIKLKNIKLPPIPPSKYQKNILVFIWWKIPNVLSWDIYNKISTDLQNLGYNIKTLSDKKFQKADYLLSIPDNTFFVGDVKYTDFLKNYDLFIWVDGWVLHYSSQFIKCISICTSTNFRCAYPFGLNIKKYELKEKWAFFKIDNRHIIITKPLKCQGCFQIWCSQKKCEKSLDIESEIFIKEVIEKIKI